MGGWCGGLGRLRSRDSRTMWAAPTTIERLASLEARGLDHACGERGATDKPSVSASRRELLPLSKSDELARDKRSSALQVHLAAAILVASFPHVGAPRAGANVEWLSATAEPAVSAGLPTSAAGLPTYAGSMPVGNGPLTLYLQTPRRAAFFFHHQASHSCTTASSSVCCRWRFRRTHAARRLWKRMFLVEFWCGTWIFSPLSAVAVKCYSFTTHLRPPLRTYRSRSTGALPRKAGPQGPAGRLLRRWSRTPPSTSA